MLSRVLINQSSSKIPQYIRLFPDIHNTQCSTKLLPHYLTLLNIHNTQRNYITYRDITKLNLHNKLGPQIQKRGISSMDFFMNEKNKPILYIVIFPGLCIGIFCIVIPYLIISELIIPAVSFNIYFSCVTIFIVTMLSISLFDQSNLENENNGDVGNIDENKNILEDEIIDEE